MKLTRDLKKKKKNDNDIEDLLSNIYVSLDSWKMIKQLLLSPILLDCVPRLVYLEYSKKYKYKINTNKQLLY